MGERKPHPLPAAPAALLALLCLGGCQTLAVNSLAPIAPPAPSFVPTVEHTVGDFTFSMGSAEPKPSHLDGKLLGNEIMDAWKERGYIREEKFIKSGKTFSGNADYQLTLTGSQRNDVSFWRELLNALTLMWAPYTVTQEYDLQYVLEDVKTGKTYEAYVQAKDESQVEIFLLLTLPIAFRGHDTTMKVVGDHLYDQFRIQGAFGASPDHAEREGTPPAVP